MPGVSRRDKPLKASASIEELLDSAISAPSEGDILAYTSSKWQNVKALTGDYAITGTWQATDLIVDDDLTVGDDLIVTGLATIGETLAVAGATTLSGAATLESTLDVTGAATLSDDLTVAGALTGAGFSFSGSGSVAGDLDVTGALSAGSLTLTSLALSGDIAAANGGLSGDLSVTGDVIVGGQLTSGVAVGAPIIGGADGSFSDTLTLGGDSVVVVTDGIATLSDVNTASEATGEVLYWDGTDWVNTGGLVVTPGTSAGETTLVKVVDGDGEVGEFFKDGSSGIFGFDNREHGGGFLLRGEDNSGVLQNLFFADPDGALIGYYAGNPALTTAAQGVNIQDPDLSGFVAMSFTAATNQRADFTLNSANGQFVIVNRVHGGRVILKGEDAGGTLQSLLDADADGSVSLYYAGSAAIATSSLGLDVTAPGGAGSNARILFTDGDGESAVFSKTASSDFFIINQTHGARVLLRAEDAGGTTRTLCVGDPDGAFEGHYAGTPEFATKSGGFVVNNDLDVGGDTTLTGTLEVGGTGDNIVLNSDEAGSPTDDAGIYVERGTSSNSHLEWDETNDYWELNAAGSAIIQAGASTLGFFGTTPASQAAAYTPTNVTTDRSFDADTVAVTELADVVGTLIADLQAYGLLQ